MLLSFGPEGRQLPQEALQGWAEPAAPQEEAEVSMAIRVRTVPQTDAINIYPYVGYMRL